MLFRIFLLSAVASLVLPAQIEAWRYFPSRGEDVRLTKTLDDATGCIGVEARTLDGRPLDHSELLRREHTRANSPRSKLHPTLLDGAAGKVRLDLWLRFRPEEVDQRHLLQQLREGGVAERDARMCLLERVAAANRAIVTPTEQLLRSLGVEVIYSDTYAPLISCVVEPSRLADLARIPEIARISPAFPAKPSLASARGTHRWDRVFDFGIRGDGVRLAVVEEGRIDTAGTAINVVATHLSGQPLAGHATAVASIAGSDDPFRPGYARGVEVLNANTATGLLTDFATATGWAITQGAAVLNCSANIDDASLLLTAWDYYVDYVVRYLRVTYTVSAANAGLGSGSVKSPALAWNVITVGAADDAGTADWVDDTMADYSSFHDPVSIHGDREKPEITAVGSNLQIVGLGGAPTTVSGTSFAAPSMAGIAASLMQANPDLTTNPELMKAVLMAAATHNIEGASRLSEKDGAGCINGLQALRILERKQTTFGTLLLGSFSNNGYHTEDAYLIGGATTRIVLCWTSDADAAYTMDQLDADLDLVVFQGQGTTTGPIVAGSMSWDNSYEIAEFCPATTGWYTIGVSSSSFNGTSEPFGIAWTQEGDGRHARFRPGYPDVLSSDASGPTIGNPSFFLSPRDVVNPLHQYICVASGSDLGGFALPGCRRLLVDLDIVSDLSLMPGNGYFFDFQGSLDAFGEAPTTRMAVPDFPFLAGFPLHFGMVTLDPMAIGGIKEIAREETVTLWDHAVDLGLGDDDSQAVNLGFSFPFFGGSYPIAHINSNGNITFTSPDSSYQESVGTFLSGLERIAPFWDDLDPTAGGAVRARFAGDRFVVEWVDVPQFSGGDQNSAIVILHQSGKIEFKYRDCGLDDAIVGITPGGGITGYSVDLTHGSRAPDPLLYIAQPAIYEEFTGPGDALDLDTSNDHRTTLTFTPTGLAVGNYRVTVDLDQ